MLSITGTEALFDDLCHFPVLAIQVFLSRTTFHLPFHLAYDKMPMCHHIMSARCHILANICYSNCCSNSYKSSHHIRDLLDNKASSCTWLFSPCKEPKSARKCIWS
ncbi:hypothetical protein GUJ93_ZPchr0013g37912 [Zizania palustris]|uniref:Uncharacterized protein n=1 Tax=Zizania palustris TaxID=103762 RepID=A0A8J5X1W9_ZIZPA|nr:hypothetical protein GUJ93_ZPchr0013g37912 [Zizania palustris]